jgi:tripeptide aminopeptidase
VRPASDVERQRLVDLFVDLCRIASPSGREAACSARVAEELRGMGLQPSADGSGNLLARIPGRGERTVMLCAHVDTVPVVGDVVEPEFVDGGWENARPAILGADNKAAVAVILEAARRCSIEGSPVNLELLFTTGEEEALKGAKAFDVSALEADFGFVFDHATPIGEVITATPTYYRIDAEFLGRSAHAGMHPESGRSAILAAARAMAAMPHGRIDAETTANIGSVHGGGETTNVVAERCLVAAETRSLSAARAEEMVASILDALHDAAADTECDLDVVTAKLFDGYKVKSTSPALLAGEAALRECGYEPRRISTGGGSDANAFEAAGLHCVNLANGTERPHEPTERVSKLALESMLDVTFALLDHC